MTLILIGMSKTNAQELIIFKGKFGSIRDTAYYYIDSNTKNQGVITCNSDGNYSLLIALDNSDTLTIFYKNNEYCPQKINTKKIQKQCKLLNLNEVINDLYLLNGFACNRVTVTNDDDMDKFGGNWISPNNLTINIDGDYKREIIENGIKYIEEGQISVDENSLTLKSVYIKNTETGTYQEFARVTSLKLHDDKLITTEGVEYIKCK